MQVADKTRDARGTAILAVVCLVLQLALAPNIALGNNVSISDIYLDVNNNYSTGETASKVTVAGPLTINSIIGNGAVVNNSNLVISEPLPASIKYDEASTGTVEIDNATGLENTITGEFKIPNASYLVNSITIKVSAHLDTSSEAGAGIKISDIAVLAK